MLKKLRLRFVCVLMAIVTVTLCLMFGLVYHFTRENLESQALSMMESVVEDPLQLGRPNSRSQEMKLPYFLIKVSAHGELVAVSGGYYDLSDETFLKDLILRVSEAGTDSGMIPEYNLRYLLTRSYASSTLVFADMSSEKTTLKTLATAFAGIGLLCLLAFLAIAELLARWMVRPAEKAWSQQRQFVSDASHELKTPLTVILTNAELMQMTEEPETQSKCLGSILTMAHQMRALVEELLELARSDNDQSKMVFEALNFSELVTDGLLPFDAVFFEKGLTLEEQVTPDIMLTGSRQYLGQLLDILLDNARKYATGGIVAVTLDRSGRKHCRLTVSNDSEQLSEAECKDIFRRFYRRDQARSRDGSFGLGLSIAETVAKTQGGKIWAEWKEGRITFTAELPCE